MKQISKRLDRLLGLMQNIIIRSILELSNYWKTLELEPLKNACEISDETIDPTKELIKPKFQVCPNC